MGKKKPEEEKKYWQQVWSRALNNTPRRIYHTTDQMFIPMYGLPAPLFIALSARDNIRKNDDGFDALFREKAPYTRRVLVKGRYAILDRKIIFALLGDFDRYAHRRLTRALHDGTCPGNLKRRERLLKMAESSEFAWDFLRERGIDYLYSSENNPEGEYETILNPKTKRRW